MQNLVIAGLDLPIQYFVQSVKDWMTRLNPGIEWNGVCAIRY